MVLEAGSLVDQSHGDPDFRALSCQDPNVFHTREEEACTGGHQRTAMRTQEERSGSLEDSEDAGLVLDGLLMAVTAAQVMLCL